MKRLGFATLIFLAGNSLFAQENWMSFPARQDSGRANQVALDYNGEKGKIMVHQDKRMDDIGQFLRSGEENVDGVLIDGYRIVIFFDQSKSKVEQQKVMFLSKYSQKHKVYIDYNAPNYRLRVGNFRTRLDAEAFKAELLNQFPTAIVVKDLIQLPELPGESNGNSEIDE